MKKDPLFTASMFALFGASLALWVGLVFAIRALAALCRTLFPVLVLGSLLLFLGGCYWPYCQETESLTIRYVPQEAPSYDTIPIPEEGQQVELTYTNYTTYGSFNLMTNRKSDYISARSRSTSFEVGENSTIQDPNMLREIRGSALDIIKMFMAP